MNHFVDIVRADGRTERQPLKAGETTLGKSAEADISLVDAVELEPIHLLFAPRGDGCWVSSAKGAQAQAHVMGKVFESGLLGWGTELDVGSVTLTINDVIEEEAGQSRTKNMVMLAMVLVMGVGGYFFLLEEDDALPQQTVSAPDSLFDKLNKSCPGVQGNVKVRGEYAREAAIAKAERYPFYSQDGIAAVQHYLSASSCYEEAGEIKIADRMKLKHQTLRNRLEEDYQVHRLRLGQALRNQQISAALVEISALRALLEHKPSPYTEWLTRLERYLKLRLTDS